MGHLHRRNSETFLVVKCQSVLFIVETVALESILDATSHQFQFVWLFVGRRQVEMASCWTDQR
jgi:hypothetical protein